MHEQRQFRIRAAYGKYKDWNSWVWSHYGQVRQQRDAPWQDCEGQQPYQSWEKACSHLEQLYTLDTVMQHFVD